MNQLKQIKNNLKQKKVLKNYNSTFKHKQMRFLLTKLSLIFIDKIDEEIFTELEIKLHQNEKSSKMFIESIDILKKQTKYKADWNSFSKFLWYVYQTSTYYNDSKKNIKNVYTNKIIKTNEIRRNLYNTWMESMAEYDLDFNEKIIKVSRLVF
ncbi:MAG: hypothetical protein KAG14_04100 [Mycoplasmataceae bacterium]|nr:hypothetical protein [Mycoplasmataceae bacterium]